MKIKGMMALTGMLLAVILTGTPALAAGGDTRLLPVEAVLAALAETEAASPVDEGTDPAAAFRALIERYRREQPDLTDVEAGRRWGGLVKTFLAISERPMRGPVQPLEMGLLWEVLPGPAAWPWIAADTGNATLQLIGAVLTNDRDAWWRQLQAAAAVQPAGQDYEKQQARQALGAMVEAYAAGCDEPDSLAAALELRLRLIEAQLADQPDQHQGYYQTLKLPEIVTVLGPGPAEAILRRALRLPQTLEAPPGSETSRLALRLAVAADTDALGAPQWRLAASPDGFALYERCAAQFPKRDNDWQRGQARAWYLLGLASRGRMAEAVAGAAKLMGNEHNLCEPIKTMVRDGHGAEVREFLRAALAQQPDLSVWNYYAERSIQDGRGAELIELARRTLADSPTLPHRAEVAQHLFAALLAADRIPEAAELVARVAGWSTPDAGAAAAAPAEAASETAPASEEAEAETPAGDGDEAAADGEEAEAGMVDEAVFHVPRDQADDLCALGRQALAAGELLRDEGMVENGMRILRAATRGNDHNADNARMNVVRFLLMHNRLAEAQAEVVAVMRAKANARRAGEDRYAWQMIADEDVLLLAEIYRRAGQWSEVLALFDTAPVWSDTNAPLWRYTQVNEQATEALAFALTQARRRDEALGVIRHLLECQPGFDSGYALLLELDPPDLIPFLDTLATRDQFEERPLIWKAVVLAKRGDLAAAEAAARRALEIDPTDGDQGPGNRVLAYATLRDILRLRGETETAGVLDRLVAAVRAAEAADRWKDAGLASRSIALYAAALGQFADAYCIQAKLAVQLARAGRAAEAAEHFQRAFELLPGQVGRMETLCFGCDGVYGDASAMDIADSVFSRLHREQPANPRVAYLLGNLRVEQERYAEAAALYRVAVALDSEYLNAWHRLDELKDKLWLPTATRRETVQQLARLNPSGNHTHYQAEDLGDPALTWRLAETMAGTVRDPLVYPVHPAPRPALAAEDPEQAYRRSIQTRWQGDPRSVPRQMVRQLPALEALDTLIQLARNRSEMSSVVYYDF